MIVNSEFVSMETQVRICQAYRKMQQAGRGLDGCTCTLCRAEAFSGLTHQGIIQVIWLSGMAQRAVEAICDANQTGDFTLPCMCGRKDCNHA